MSLNIGNIGSTVKRAKGFVNSALGSVRSQAGKYTNLMGQSDASDGGGGNAILTYPSDLRAKSNENLPLIEFTAHERNPSPGQDAAGEKKPGTGFHTIYLPVTSSLVFSDSSNYNTINLSGAGAKIGQALLEGGRAPTDILTSMGAAVAEAKETASKISISYQYFIFDGRSESCRERNASSRIYTRFYRRLH